MIETRNEITSTSFEIPIKTVSEANAHAHWRQRQKRAKGQRAIANALTLANVRLSERSIQARITLTRRAPRKLDSDNLAGSCKHIRDGIADALGFDDRDERCEWIYKQDYQSKAYSVLVEIVRRQTGGGR